VVGGKDFTTSEDASLEGGYEDEIGLIKALGLIA